MKAALIGMVALGACGSGKGSLGKGPELDGRLVSDVYTWPCGSSDDEWEGAYAQTVALQFSPDALTPLDLPFVGSCASDLSMFPVDAGGVGSDLPEVSGDIDWTTGAGSGQLEPQATGFWFDDVFSNYMSCEEVEDLLEGGVTLGDAGPLSGVAAPEPGRTARVQRDPDDRVVAWGQPLTLEWQAADWSESWVQIRRERSGELFGSVTCNTTGLDTFTITSDVWALLGDEQSGTSANVYTAVQNSALFETDDGQRVETLTRSVAVAVVNSG